MCVRFEIIQTKSVCFLTQVTITKLTFQNLNERYIFQIFNAKATVVTVVVVILEKDQTLKHVGNYDPIHLTHIWPHPTCVMLSKNLTTTKSYNY